MFLAFHVLTVMLVAIAMALSLAHALELPGKMRLDQKAYYEVQRIYYPGFTIGGTSESIGSILTLVLLWLTPYGSVAFWLTLVALFGLVGMQAIYWLITHPVNKVWTQGHAMNTAGSSFFSFGTKSAPAEDWKALRNRWEYSHVARAGLAFVGLLALVIALSN